MSADGSLEPGFHYARRSPWVDVWQVLRKSEENSPSWDRVVLTGLKQSTAEKIALILTEEVE